MQRIFLCLIVVFAGIFFPDARAALSCEQLVAASQAAIALRNQGLSLSEVLAEVERGEIRRTLDAQEVNLLRQIVRLSFTSEYSPREILTACNAGELGIAKPKP